MNKTEQGVLQQNRWRHPLVHALLLLTFCLTHNVAAEALVPMPHENIKDIHRVFNIYSPDSRLQSSIASKLSDNLSRKRSDIIVKEKTPAQEINKIDQHNDIIVGIGQAGTKSAIQRFPKIKKLLISTDPNKNKLHINENDATLYMTQSYCRQIKFIRLLNTQWEIISILSSKKKPVDSKPIEQCANKYGFKIYLVNTSAEENQTNK